MTARDIRALRARRSELSDQLTSAASRRDRLAEELQAADPSIRAGIQDRIKLLDERIIQLEADIAETGRQMSSSEAGLAQTSSQIPEGLPVLGPGEITAIAIVFTIVVLMPLSIALARAIWRRATMRPARESGEVTERLTRLEQAVDAVAIEVERISEGQRYVTRVLTGQPHSSGTPQIGAGQQPAEPIRARGERVGVRRDEG